MCLAHKRRSVLPIMTIIIVRASSFEGLEVHWCHLLVMRTKFSWQRHWLTLLSERWSSYYWDVKMIRQPCPQTFWFNGEKVYTNPGNEWCGEGRDQCAEHTISGWVWKQPAFSSKLECLAHLCVLGAEGCILPFYHGSLVTRNGPIHIVKLNLI